MCQLIYIFLITFVFFNCTVLATDYSVILTSNGPVVQGAEITFIAKVYTSSGEVPSEEFKYVWSDNGLPTHTRTKISESAEDQWSVTYPADRYPAGPYEVQVILYRKFIIFYEVTSRRIDFNITDKLNGKMLLIQNELVRPTDFVSNATAVTHAISLNPQDYLYLKDNATSILTYWFIDCNYFGMTSNFTFEYKYDKPESSHVMEALVVADFTPITTPAPTTTTTTSTTTPSTTTTSTTTTSTTPTPTTTPTTTTTTKTTTASTKKRRKRVVSNIAPTMITTNGSIIHLGENNTFPYVCLNQTNIPPDPKKAYGYFARMMTVKAPVPNITVIGTNWLQHGDMLSLGVKCQGSPTFNYCYYFMSGLHNITGNETCMNDWETSDKCEFNITRYFKEPGENTLIIIVKNDVSKIVSPVLINIYKVTKHSQLSVIVVPVSFSLVAVVLIVFGMAYYFQNRTRFTVEVADFDFGQTYSDLEYKTFRERLRDSITNALTRTPITDQQDPPLWPPSSRKYGSMT